MHGLAVLERQETCANHNTAEFSPFSLLKSRLADQLRRPLCALWADISIAFWMGRGSKSMSEEANRRRTERNMVIQTENDARTLEGWVNVVDKSVPVGRLLFINGVARRKGPNRVVALESSTCLSE
jgi:hypothetical protein